VKTSLKILHTADWHLGLVSWQRLAGIDRGEEQREALEQMITVAHEEKVDLVVHSGDLFHQYNRPPRNAIAMAVEAIMRFRSIAPFVWVVGNHDWYAMGALQEVFFPDVFILREFTPVDIPTLPVTVFPYPYISLSRLLGGKTGAELQEQAREKMINLFREWEETLQDSRWNVLAAHCTLEDCAWYAQANSVRELFLKSTDFPGGMHYGAFGHLHAFIQHSDGKFPLVYPSPLVRDTFQQEKEQTGCVLVELVKEKEAVVKHVSLPSVRLVTVDVEEDADLPNLVNTTEELTGGEAAYIRFRIKSSGVPLRLRSRLAGLRGENWQTVAVESAFLSPGETAEIQGEEAMDVRAVPELFSVFCRSMGHSERVVDLFKRYYQEAVEEEGRDASG